MKSILSEAHCECRYRSKGVLLGKVRPRIKWADVEAVKAALEEQLNELLGGVTEEDLREPEKKKKRKVTPSVSKLTHR